MDDELIRFRQDWLNEVASRKQSQPDQQLEELQNKSINNTNNNNNTSESTSSHLDDVIFSFHGGAKTSKSSFNFSSTELEAIQLFELAVEKEHSGKLNDAVLLYRDAFKKDSNVDKLYREKWFSHYKTSATSNSTSSTSTISKFDKKRKSIDGNKIKINNNNNNDNDKLHDSNELTKISSFTSDKSADYDEYNGDLDNKSLIKQSSLDESEALVSSLEDLKISPENEDEYSLFSHLPIEICSSILKEVALMDIALFKKVLTTCKLLHHIGVTSQDIWKSLCMLEYPYQHYSRDAFQSCYGSDIPESLEINNINYHLSPNEELESSVLWNPDFKNMWYGQWRLMYLQRPRIKFDGIYISTSNYSRPGRGDGWYAPVIMVTYYRYLRFYRDGSCISLLTTDEPRDVVPMFVRQSLKRKSQAINSTAAVTRADGTVISRPKGIVPGTWEMESPEGRVLVEIEGSVDRYMFYLNLDICSSGSKRHNKLKWVEFWSVNKISQDRATFNLKHDKPYYFLKYRWDDGEPFV